MAARNGRMRRSAPMVPAEAEAAVEARGAWVKRARARYGKKGIARTRWAGGEEAFSDVSFARRLLSHGSRTMCSE